ncbi:MAG: enoyl-CoA hydratase/isomerase family protein [Gammaproteobacteria bacterium]|nr:enoyl-CoA hydratase/isomerase family protein [Gammaproteobacteria bacterium]
MSYENILLEQKEDGIWLLTINRPRALNALNIATLEELAAAIDELEQTADARVLLVTGAGEKAFVAGADITEMQAMSPLEARDHSNRTIGTFRRLETLSIPVIALVNGFCLGGGCELAMSCDWIIASDRAVFGQPEVNLGIIPGFGGTQRLPRLIGPARATEMIVTGRQVKAQQAVDWGLATEVCIADELMEKGLASARSVLGRGPLAVRMAKEAVVRGQDLDLENACLLESEVFGVCFSTQDRVEGVSAFMEKRKPAFKGT